MIIEVLGLGFSLFALSRVYLRFREGRISWGMMAVWSMVWLTSIAFILSPQSFGGFSSAIGVQRPLDLMFIGALIIAYYMTFRVYVYVEEIRSDMAQVVREVALREGEK
jgi:hypothetical protein